MEGASQSKAKGRKINTKRVRKFKGGENGGEITDVSASADGKWVGIVQRDELVTFWNSGHYGKETSQLKLHTGLEDGLTLYRSELMFKS
jgi:hypothetical protein